jgi:hypothetical protein
VRVLGALIPVPGAMPLYSLPPSPTTAYFDISVKATFVSCWEQKRGKDRTIIVF